MAGLIQLNPLSVLHCSDISACHFPGHQSVCLLYTKRMGHLFHVFPASHGGPADVSRVRGSPLFDIHDDHAGHPADRHLE